MSHYQHLTISERECILKSTTEGNSIRTIAKELGRSPSTISRELRRNGSKRSYWPSQAQAQYQKRRKRSRRQCILEDPQAKLFVRRLILEEQWSPEEISRRAKLEKSPYQMSYSTIYRAIYAGKLEVKKLSHGARGIARKLRHRGKKRHSKNKKETRGKFQICHSIEERPAAANDRLELGHWEADTVIGKIDASCFVSITCRMSRYTMGIRIPRRSAANVQEALIYLLGQLPSDRVKSITPDRGMEFANHAEITKALGGVPFYFPPPRCPWARGTNENTNGLIREYCPKGVDMDTFDEAYFTTFLDKLNRRPRKCLNYRTPFEVFFGCVLHLT